MTHSKRLALLVAALSAVVVAAPAIAHAAPPSNDDFANAAPVTGLPFSATVGISEATLQTNEPIGDSNYQGRTVWFSFTPTASAMVRVEAGGSVGEPFLVVYRADSAGFAGLTRIAGDYWGTPTGSTLKLLAGNTYYIQGGDRYAVWGFTNTFGVSLTAVLPPENDNFSDAINVEQVPFSAAPVLTAATTELMEPTTTCGTQITQSAWYKFTPTTSGGYGGRGDGVNVYTGTSLGDLNSVACPTWFGLYFHADAGTTYYLQVHNGGSLSGLGIELLPPPNVEFYWNPSAPSIFDPVSFGKPYFDPTITSLKWDFGDGTTTEGPDSNPQHTYKADGDYRVTMTATTVDARTNAGTQTVQVRTHDVSVLWATATSKGRVGRTSPIQIGVGNTRYPEMVEVNFYKNTPSGPQWIGTVTQTVPKLAKNKATTFSVDYTFTSSDLVVGKVNFQVVASIRGATDAYPGDNSATTASTTVTR